MCSLSHIYTDSQRLTQRDPQRHLEKRERLMHTDSRAQRDTLTQTFSERPSQRTLSRTEKLT